MRSRSIFIDLKLLLRGARRGEGKDEEKRRRESSEQKRRIISQSVRGKEKGEAERRSYEKRFGEIGEGGKKRKRKRRSKEKRGQEKRGECRRAES